MIATTGRLDSLTGLRFVAALAVFGSHTVLVQHVGFLTGQGLVAVSFFFILSGFVLMWSRGAVTAASFYRRRIARIYPAYIVAWIVGLAMTQSDGGFFTFAWVPQFLAGTVFAQAWIPDISWNFAINSPAWSLSCEAFFYLTFPLWANWLATCPQATRRLLAGMAALTVIAVAGVVQLGAHHEYLGTPNETPIWILRTLPITRIPEFFLGAWLAVELREGRFNRIRIMPALLLATIAYVLAGVRQTAFTTAAITLVPFLLLIAAGASADLRNQRTIFNRRSAVWLGGISYCFYLIHELVLRAMRYALPAFGSTVTAVPLALFVALLGSALLHYRIERPAERRLRGRNSVTVQGTDALRT